MITFDKYDLHGDYHWVEFAKETEYRKHVLFLKEWIGEQQLLDIGAGAGLIASQFNDCYAIEVNATARTLAAQHDVVVHEGDAYDLSGLPQRFPAILLGDVLEHLEFPERALLQARSAMLDDGVIYIAVPPSAGDVKEYHYREYTPELLQRSVEVCGLKLDGEIEANNGRLYAKFRKATLKVELGGGTRSRGEQFVNVDVVPEADIEWNLDQTPYPFPDNSIDELYSSHCMEHLVCPLRTFTEIARICKVGARVEIRVPHPGNQMAMCAGHLHVVSPMMIDNMDLHFPELHWKGPRRLKLRNLIYGPTPWMPRAKQELPFLRGLDDQTIMRWIPNTCHESQFQFEVINNDHHQQ